MATYEQIYRALISAGAAPGTADMTARRYANQMQTAASQFSGSASGAGRAVAGGLGQIGRMAAGLAGGAYRPPARQPSAPAPTGSTYVPPRTYPGQGSGSFPARGAYPSGWGGAAGVARGYGVTPRYAAPQRSQSPSRAPARTPSAPAPRSGSPSRTAPRAAAPAAPTANPFAGHDAMLRGLPPVSAIPASDYSYDIGADSTSVTPVQAMLSAMSGAPTGPVSPYNTMNQYASSSGPPATSVQTSAEAARRALINATAQQLASEEFMATVRALAAEGGYQV